MRRAEVHVREVHGGVQVSGRRMHMRSTLVPCARRKCRHCPRVRRHRVMLIPGGNMRAAIGAMRPEPRGEEGVGVDGAAAGRHMSTGSPAGHPHGALVAGRGGEQVIVGAMGGARHRSEGMVWRPAREEVRMRRWWRLRGLIALRGNRDGSSGREGGRVQVRLSRWRRKFEARSADGGGLHSGGVV